MIELLKNPKHAAFWVPASVLGVIAVGAVLSWPQLSEAKARSEASERALSRGDNCLVLEKGRIVEGGYYVTLESKDDGKTYETLIGDGVTTCDTTGGTAQTKNKTAAFFRRAETTAFQAKLADRFGVDESGAVIIPDEVKIYPSTVWKPDFSKRKQTKAQPNQGGLLDWLFTNNKGK
jgi:hypothetical protein